MAYQNLPSPTVSNGEIVFAVPGSAAGTLYVRRKASGSTPAGTPATAVVAALSTPLTAPAGVAATATSASQIGASWNTVANNAGYSVQRATDAAFTQNVVTAAAATNATSLALTGLSTNTLYYVRVKTLGTGAYADSPFSAAVSATTLAANLPLDVNPIFFGTSIFTDVYTPYADSQVAALVSAYSAASKPGVISNAVKKAVSGQRLLTNGSDIGMVDTFEQQIAGTMVTDKLNLVFIDGPTNELSNQVAGSSAAGAAERTLDALNLWLDKLLAYATTNNYPLRIVTGDITPRTNPGTVQPAFENERLTYQQLLEDALTNGTAKFHAYAYVGRDYRSYQPGPNVDGSPSTYYVDTVHPSGAGRDQIWVPAYTAAAMKAIHGIAQPPPPSPPVSTTPDIESFFPYGAASGTLVTVQGVNLSSPTSVTMNGITAPFTAVNATTLTVTVPSGATGNQITFTSAAGTTSATATTTDYRANATNPTYFAIRDSNLFTRDPALGGLAYTANFGELAYGNFAFQGPAYVQVYGSTIADATQRGVARIDLDSGLQTHTHDTQTDDPTTANNLWHDFGLLSAGNHLIDIRKTTDDLKYIFICYFRVTSFS